MVNDTIKVLEEILADPMKMLINNMDDKGESALTQAIDILKRVRDVEGIAKVLMKIPEDVEVTTEYIAKAISKMLGGSQ